jgi:pimeloyl-ACP methyl ester carboxylesterase
LGEINPPDLPSYLTHDVNVVLSYFPKAPDPAFDARMGREMGSYGKLVRDNGQGNPKLAHWLHRITVPTLVLWGDADRLRPTAQAQAWVDLLPDAELKLVPRTGHLLFEETPSAADIVTNFLAG